MSKLYIFAIGGTGARVLKSLSFLLAAGAKCNASKVIPIIIDPDAANGDVSRTTNILRSYQNIRSSLTYESETKNKFFEIDIESFTQNFKIKIQDSNKKFKDFIDYGSLDAKNKALTSVLFSEDNLNADMEVGFKGNPNMGSVVLNQFQHSEDFIDFASSFNSNDRIFIISSIFGGTGASGFPLLLKNLREPSKNLPNHALLKEANIGAISILPYFGVKNDPDATVDRRTFISKTKAALSYYENEVNHSLNTMYYIGDDITKEYDNNEGSAAQKNDAHFIELAAALSILDFTNSPTNETSQIKEFGIKDNAKKITFNDLHDITKDKVFKPLAQYYLSHLFLKKNLRKSLHQNYASKLGLNSSTLNSPFFNELQKFNNEFWQWLTQMDNNDRGFSPFTLEENSEEIFDSINGINLKRGNFLGPKNYERYITFLNKAQKSNDPTAKSLESRFMEINYVATENLLKEK